MIKKQVDFQIATYYYPSDADRMRKEVKAFQESGWEVMQPLLGGVRKTHGGADTDLLFLPVAKYVYVDEYANAKSNVDAKKVGRPKKTEE